MYPLLVTIHAPMNHLTSTQIMNKYHVLSTILLLVFLAWSVRNSTFIHPAADIPKPTLSVLADDATIWRSAFARTNLALLLRILTLYISWLAIAFVLVGLKPAVKAVTGLIQAFSSRKKHSLVLACLLLQPFHAPIAEGATFMYPNGTSVVDFPHDVVFKSGVRAGSPSGILFDTQNKADITFDAGPDHAVQLVTSRFDLVGTTLNLTGLGQVNFDQILSQSLLINGTLITTTASNIDIVLSPKGGGVVRVGKTLDVRGVTLLLDDDQISGDKIEGGVISAVTITNLTTTQLNIDIIGTDVKLAAGKTLDVSEGTLQLAENQISGDSINGGTIDATTITTLTAGTVKADTLTGNSGNTVTLASGKTLDVSQGVLQLTSGQISGDKIKGGVIPQVTITNLTVDSLGQSVTLVGTLDVSQGTLRLADGQISGDKIKGGSILVTNLTATRINVDTISTTVKIAPGESLDVRGATILVDQMSVDNLKLDGNTVRSTSGDLELMCPAGQVIKVGDTLAVGQLVMKGNTLNTTDHHTLLLAPHGLGSVKVLEGKTLDLRGATLLLDDDAIRGDKVDGGFIHNITIFELVSGQIQIGSLKLGSETISSTGDIQLTPGSGRKTLTLRPLEVEKLHLEDTTISTTTGVPVTINNMTCPVATFNEVTIGNLKLQGNTITDIAGDKVIMQNNVELASGKTITSSEVKTSTISTTSGDLTLNPAGSNVKVTSGKTLDLSGATLKLDDDAISGDKIEGGTMTVDTLAVSDTARADHVEAQSSLTVGANTTSLGSGEAVSVDGGVKASGGFRDGHAWSSETARRCQLALGVNNGGFGSALFTGGPMNASFFEGFDASGVAPGNMNGFRGAVFDGRYVYMIPYCGGTSGKVLRYDTQQSFTSSISWTGYDAVDTSPGNMKGFNGAAFDGQYVYMAPGYHGAYHGKVLRYDTRQPFASSSSWIGYDASGTSPGNMKGFWGAVFDGRCMYIIPHRDPAFHGRVLRYDTRQNFTSNDSWTGYDASGTSPGNMKGFVGGVFDGQYVYMIPYSDGTYHGRVLRYDTQHSFTASSSWKGYDASETSPGNMRGFTGAVFDGRYIFMIPWHDSTSNSGKVLRYDTKQSFTSSSSWTGYDASGTSPGNMRGFIGGVFDGRYVYMIPYHDGTVYSGKVLRYDTQQSFTSVGSWLGYDMSATSPGSVKGFRGAVFDGRYVYLVPNYDGTSYSGKVLRYDTRTPQPRPSIQQIASNSDLFISSQSNVGIGTTTPSQKLHVEGSLGVTDKVGVGTVSPSTSLDVKGTARADHVEVQSSLTVGANTTSLGNGEAVRVEGGVGAKGGFRDSHAWLSSTSAGAVLSFQSYFGDSEFANATYDIYHANGTRGYHAFGYEGAISDGRYIYFYPGYVQYLAKSSGVVLRLDTQGLFGSPSSWDAYDASNTDGIATGNFRGGVFDGRYVYFSPYGMYHCKILRLDTQSAFLAPSSWSAFDAVSTEGKQTGGFTGAVFDGRYVFFVPLYNGAAYNGIVLRYDTQHDFKSSGSYAAYDAGNTDGLVAKGYSGAVFTGRYVIFVPFISPLYHGVVLRYDTASLFHGAASWSCYNANPTSGMVTVGYNHGAFDGRFVYMAPYYDGTSLHGRVLRYDTASPFKDSNSWMAVDVAVLVGSDAKGFWGVVGDGRYLYFTRHASPSTALLRYDTRGDFAAPRSWEMLKISAQLLAHPNYVGYHSGWFDGRYIYLAPMYSGDVLRYDTRAPQPRPSLAQIATSSDLFIASNGSVGIGTKSPGEKLSVEGGVMARGGFRDSHAWGSETARRSQLALGINHGGSGSSIFTGGPMNSSFFEGYDASGTFPGNMKGFHGAIFDGRFVYFVPHHDGSSNSGRILRLDAQSSFTSSSSWTGYDASSTSPGSMKGFIGAVFDGRFVYIVPDFEGGSSFGRVLRYDTQSSFTSSSSWTGYDASGTSPGNMVGFGGAVFDGRFVYFVPFRDSSGRVLRYDTHSSFLSSSSWTGYDASGTSPGNMKGFGGAVFDGTFVYFVPSSDGSSLHGRVLQYDTQSNFTSSSSWSGYDASGTSPGNMKGFFGAVFDGRFVYFVPDFDGSSRHGRVLRHDTQSSFQSSSSWTGYDASGTSPGNMRGFYGAVFDGRFIYFVPYYDGSYLGSVLRYDTQSIFTSSSSWTGFDASGTSPGNMKGFRGAVFDGRFVYFVPYNDGSSHGKVLRYDTRAPERRPSIQQIASNKDLFIASDGKVGIGSTSPTEMLHVVGNIKATGTVTATTCCGSDIRLKKDVTSFSGALETIKKMRGIRYKWKANDEPSIGFVAQELESVVPEVVVTGSDGYKAVDYGKLSAVLAVAVQEHVKETEELRNKMSKMEQQHHDEIDALKQQVRSKMNRMEQRLESLEQAPNMRSSA